MEVRRALKIFKLNKRLPIEELNSVFRELVKKYHPDKLLEYPDWAHERMSEINDAYETLVTWLSKPPGKPQKNPPQQAEREKNEEHLREEPIRGKTTFLSAAERKILYPPFNQFLDGMGIYYQYGLDNPAYREEGIRRFRYREALRKLTKARDVLIDYSKTNRNPIIQTVSRFVRLTVAEMEFGEPVFEDMMVFRKFDDRFRSARRSFDDAVKEIFFPELIPRHLSGRASSGLYACYTSFILYLTVFPEGERRDAGILMTARYDAFMDLVELRNEGILNF